MSATSQPILSPAFFPVAAIAPDNIRSVEPTTPAPQGAATVLIVSPVGSARRLARYKLGILRAAAPQSSGVLATPGSTCNPLNFLNDFTAPGATSPVIPPIKAPVTGSGDIIAPAPA